MCQVSFLCPTTGKTLSSFYNSCYRLVWLKSKKYLLLISRKKKKTYVDLPEIDGLSVVESRFKVARTMTFFGLDTEDLFHLGTGSIVCASRC